MNFEVNGHNYFLTFAEEENSWYVIEPHQDGLSRIPVYVDIPSFERLGAPANGRSKIPN